MLVVGLMYDLFGRRWTMCTSTVIAALSTFLIPIVSPSIPAYQVTRCILTVSLVVALGNPFINDYVTVQSRGVATGFQTLGLLIGNLLSVSVLYTITEKLSNKIVSFALLGALQFIWTICFMLMITEPEIMSEKEERHQNKKSCLGKLFSMIKQLYKACR